MNVYRFQRENSILSKHFSFFSYFLEKKKRFFFFSLEKWKEILQYGKNFYPIGSDVEDQISEITVFKFLLRITEAWCLNHSKKENLCFWLIIMGR